MASDSDIVYTVGYKRPPANARFRKGRSGNPKGRPRGSRNLATLLDQVLDETLIASERGKRRTITKREAMLKQLVNKAASGDHRAIQILFQAFRSLVGESEGSQPEEDIREDAAQMRQLERLTVEERLELRRLLTKAQGEPGSQPTGETSALRPTGGHQVTSTEDQDEGNGNGSSET